MSVLAVLLIVASSWTIGVALWRLLRFERDEAAVFSPEILAAGLGVVSILTGLLAIAGAFRFAPFLLLALSLLAVRDVVASKRNVRAACPQCTAVDCVVGIVLAIVVLASFLPVMNDDSLAYSLPIARRIAESGSVQYWPDVWLSVLPASQTVLVAVVFLMGGDAPGVIAGLELLLCMGLLVGLAHRLGLGPAFVPVAVMIALGAPVIAHVAGSTKEDLLLCAMTLGAVLGLMESDGRDRALMTGLFAGLAAGAKYTGVWVAIACLVWIVIRPIERRRRVGLCLMAMIAAGGFWYGVNVVRFANPVPPFLSPPLGSPLSSEGTVVAKAALRPGMRLGGICCDEGVGEQRALIRSAGGYVVSHIGMWLHEVGMCLKGLIGIAGGKGNLPGPFFLLALPAFAVARVRARCAPLYFVAVVVAIFWFFSTPTTRYLLPATMLLSIPAAAFLEALPGRVSKFTSVIVVVISAILLVLAPSILLVRWMRSPASYIWRETQNYDDIRWMNAHLDPHRDRVATTFKASGYLRVPWLNLSPTYQAVIAPEEMRTGESLIGALRREGVTHLFVPRGSVASLEPWLEIVRENDASRQGGTRLVREPGTIRTVVYRVR